MKVVSLKAREIADSRGVSTVEAILETEKGIFRASVPSGISRGDYEAATIPAEEAIKKIAELEPLLARRDFSSQEEFDRFLIEQDGTKNKSDLGGNSTLALSMVFCRALAGERKMPLYQYIYETYHKSGATPDVAPVKLVRHRESHQLQQLRRLKLPRPCVLLFEGGKHAPLEALPLTGHGEGGLTFQEILLVPDGKSFAEMFNKAKAIFEGLKRRLNYPFGVEGGMAAPLNEEEVLDIVSQQAPEQIGIDVAASSFFSKGGYRFQGKEISAEELLQFYQNLIKKYNLAFIEDPFSQDDIAAWKAVSSKFKIQNSKFIIVGDDLTATNPERIKMAHERGLCNGVIIKPNQIGTVWETLQAVQLAKEFGWKIIVSHRAGETEDSFIADLAVGIGADFIKAGGLSQEVRLAKYNRLLEIEREERISN